MQCIRYKIKTRDKIRDITHKIEGKSKKQGEKRNI